MATGTVSFQANNEMDVFYVVNLHEEGVEPSDEGLIQIEDSQFDSDKAWITGNVPMIKPVQVEGDTSIINAWFKGETFDKPLIITVYVECETAEELDAVIADEAADHDENEEKDDLEPMEIHL